MVKMLYFKNDTCTICNALLPKINQIATKFPVILETINITENPIRAGQHLVFTVPVLIITDADGNELKRFVRHFSVYEVTSFLERIIQSNIE
ncbi:MAG: glutaredoxin family protein [Bacteroidales bacterium]